MTDERGNMHSCLQAHLSELGAECRSSEVWEVQMVANDASVNVPLLTACKAELATVCGVADAQTSLA